MPLAPAILSVLAIFQNAFTAPTWEKAQVLLVGTLLARGRRTVTAALRQMGRGAETDFSRSHQVLNRAPWSPLQLSRLLRQAWCQAFVAVGGSLTFVIDETLERRWGPQLRQRGHFREALLSRRKSSISNSSLALDRARASGQGTLDDPLRGAARAECPGPCAESEPAAPAPPQNGRALGASNDYASAPLVAGRAAERARRWSL